MKKYPKHSAYRRGLLVQEYKRCHGPGAYKPKKMTTRVRVRGLNRNGKINEAKWGTSTNLMFVT